MRVLVTGGTGFVGSHLVETLRAAGDTVRALVRPTGDVALVQALGAEPVSGELEDIESLRQACHGCDTVYHAAARVEIVGDYQQFHDTTIAGTQRLLEAAREAGVRRFVYVSTCGVYHPRYMNGGVINEDTPTPTPPKWFIYGRAKLQAEQAVRASAAPMEWVIIRLGYIYGPRNRTMERYLRPLLTSQPFMLIGDGENELAMLFVSDAARAIAAAGRVPEAAGATLIAAGSERVTQKDYLNALADGFGIGRPTRRMPYRLAFAGGWMCEILAKIGLNPTGAVMNRSAIALTGLPQRIDCGQTRRVLGWEPQVKFADGIRRAFDWYWREYSPGDLAASPAR